jgi:hypothetical protein
MTKLALRQRDFLSFTGAAFAAAATGMRAYAEVIPINFG